MEKSYDIVIIGGGPGGYVSAIRFAQLGKRVAIVEQAKLGGACLNRGCVPMKALLSVAKTLKDIRRGARMGVVAPQAGVDYPRVVAWNKSVMDRFRKGIDFLIKSNKIDLITGTASFITPKSVSVMPQEDVLNAATVVIATGSRPMDLPGMRFDSKRVISSDELFELPVLPKSMAIIGGGVIGVEVATAFAEMGTAVTIVEIMDQLMPGWPKDVVSPVFDSLTKLNVDIRLKTKVCALRNDESHVNLAFEGIPDMNAEYVLVAIGRRPNTDALCIGNAGVELDRKGFVKVDARLQTNVPCIFAIGDAIGTPYLAHRSSEQGLAAAEIACGCKSSFNAPPMPSVVYSDPEVGVVGIDEFEAVRQGHDAFVGKFSFAGSARAMTMGRLEGFVKLIGDRKTGALLGAQVVGAGASDLISECSLALSNRLSIEDIASSVHPHPTLSEAIMEAARAWLGKPIHGSVKP